jgi:hypothetical protein
VKDPLKELPDGEVLREKLIAASKGDRVAASYLRGALQVLDKHHRVGHAAIVREVLRRAKCLES